jgi:hypothetical protein
MKKECIMSKRVMLLAAGMLAAVVAQARHPTLTRIATPGDPTFDLVVSYWQGSPDTGTKANIENAISNLTDAVYEMTEGMFLRLHDFSGKGNLVSFCHSRCLARTLFFYAFSGITGTYPAYNLRTCVSSFYSKPSSYGEIKQKKDMQVVSVHTGALLYCISVWVA